LCGGIRARPDKNLIPAGLQAKIIGRHDKLAVVGTVDQEQFIPAARLAGVGLQ